MVSFPWTVFHLNVTYLSPVLGFPCGSAVNNPPEAQEMQETQVYPLDWEDPLEESMATHSSILAWRIPMDRGAWWAEVHGVTKSRTRLSDWAQPRGSWSAGMTDPDLAPGLLTATQTVWRSEHPLDTWMLTRWLDPIPKPSVPPLGQSAPHPPLPNTWCPSPTISTQSAAQTSVTLISDTECSGWPTV